jgi:site-specific recombinase XerD
MHWHHLRHVFAGLLDAGGAELNTISKLLGHQNVGITARIYTGVLRERKVQAIAGLPDFSRLGTQARSSS